MKTLITKWTYSGDDGQTYWDEVLSDLKPVLEFMNPNNEAWLVHQEGKGYFSINYNTPDKFLAAVIPEGEATFRIFREEHQLEISVDLEDKIYFYKIKRMSKWQ